ncbi:MAG TPA: hypothetical protein VHC19_02470 [Pirellulales bacterium]|jgi:hypothetical protein|nr:hypothetical protein [Pirellulales bacterium]
MAKKKSGINPFYVLLAPLGIVFTITACAYGVMAFKAVRGERPIAAEEGAAQQRSGAALLEYMDQHGAELMGVELALLAACTFGAISTDRYWTRRADDEKRSDAEGNQSPEQESEET